MAITCVAKPSEWARVYDSNRCTYTFSSDKYTELNYNFLIELYKYKTDVSGTTSAAKTLIGTFKMYPLENGTCEFNPTSVYKNYISSDINLSATILTDAGNSFAQFGMVVYDYYSSGITSPVKQGTPYTEPVRGTIYYNGCQQEVPYDYVPLNHLQGNNLQWVMSGDTQTLGNFLTDATEYRLDNEDVAFLYFLCESGNLPTKIKYTYYYLLTTGGVQVSIESGNDIDRLIGLPNEFFNEESREASMPQTKTSPANYSESASIDSI